MVKNIKYFLIFKIKPSCLGVFDVQFEGFNSEANQETKYFSNSCSLSKVQMDSFNLSINLFSVFEMWDKETKTPPVVPFYS